MAEQIKPLEFPTNGTEITSSPYLNVREGTTQESQNVRAMDPLEFRYRGGSRPGLSRYVDQKVNGTLPIQHLNFLVTVSADASPYAGIDFGPLYFEALAPDSSQWQYIGQDPELAALDRYGKWTPDPTDAGVDARYPRQVNVGLIPAVGIGFQPPKGRRKKLPKINWAIPSTVSPGTSLSGTQLNASAVDRTTGASLAGSFVYNPPSGTVMTAGTKQLRAIFTPTDDSYSAVAIINSLVVGNLGAG